MQGIVSVAKAAVAARVAGKSTVTLGSGGAAQTFNLVKGGYCARFVRQCVEVALGLTPHSWKYAAADALSMEAALKAAGHPVLGARVLTQRTLGWLEAVAGRVE